MTPPDVTELELEPGHPGIGDEDYVRRRKELFALCRRHRLEELGPPLIAEARRKCQDKCPDCPGRVRNRRRRRYQTFLGLLRP